MKPPVLETRSSARVALSAAVAATLLLVSSGLAQDDSARPDQVFGRKRGGNPTVLTGTVVEDGLENVVLDQSGKEVKHPSLLVDRIEWGDAPIAFRDGVLYFDRREFESATGRFRLAAGDAAAREVVRAAARLGAGRSLLRWGARNPAHFDEAVEEFSRFIDDHAESRQLPSARSLLGRARLLAGDATGAAGQFEALFGELQGETATTGYPPVLCLEAGLCAAEAQLVAGDAAAAKDLFARTDTAAATYRATLDETDERRAPLRADLQALSTRAILGEGYCALADGQVPQARAFFEGKLSSDGPAPAALRFGAGFGLAECDFAEEHWREAQLGFARISATDHTSRDRAARALVRLAQCAEKLGDTDYRKDVRTWLTTVVESYGDTPAAPEARALLQ